MSEPTARQKEVMQAIGFTEESSFREFCRELKDCPDRGDRNGWRELFGDIEWCAHMEWLTIEKRGASIESLQLTEEGAAFLK